MAPRGSGRGKRGPEDWNSGSRKTSVNVAALQQHIPGILEKEARARQKYPLGLDASTSLTEEVLTSIQLNPTTPSQS